MEEHNQSDITRQLEVSDSLRRDNKELVSQLKDALLINQVLASSVEILGEAHLTKNEKYEMIRNLNEASSIDAVQVKANIIRDQFGIQSQTQNFREVQRDDSFWSSSFRIELESYYNLYKGVDVKATLGESLGDVDKYFKFLSEYANSSPDNIESITKKILDQEPKARTGLERLKGLNISLNSIQ